jgi:hypothetical protein
MGTFTTKIPLGKIGYVVRNDGEYNFYVKEMEVGKVTIEQVHPKATSKYVYDPAYKESYMCFETGVESGTVYTYGEHIFATKEDAENIGIVKHKQRAHKEIARRDEHIAQQKEIARAREIRELVRLKEKYAYLKEYE